MPSELKSRFELNNQIGRANRAAFDAAGITAISLVGPAGSGKTSLIEALMSQLHSRVRVAVIVGNLAAERHAEHIAHFGYPTVPVVTNNLAAVHVRDALKQLHLDRLDLLLIESEGNLVNPVEFNLGHHLRACVFSVAGGDDKATEYPFLVTESDVVILTKTDLLPVVTFDFKVFNQDVMRIKPKMRIIQASVQSNQGIGRWVEWVESRLSPQIRERPSSRGFDPFVRIPNV